MSRISNGDLDPEVARALADADAQFKARQHELAAQKRRLDLGPIDWPRTLVRVALIALVVLFWACASIGGWRWFSG